MSYPHVVPVKGLADKRSYRQLVSGSGEGQILSNEPKGALYLRSEADRQSNQGIAGFFGVISSTVHFITQGFSSPRLDANTCSFPLVVPVMRLADPSPPTLKPQEFILFKGLLVL